MFWFNIAVERFALFHHNVEDYKITCANCEVCFTDEVDHLYVDRTRICYLKVNQN